MSSVGRRGPPAHAGSPPAPAPLPPAQTLLHRKGFTLSPSPGISNPRKAVASAVKGGGVGNLSPESWEGELQQRIILQRFLLKVPGTVPTKKGTFPGLLRHA